MTAFGKFLEAELYSSAVKFIRDQALTAIHNFEHENIEPDKHRGHATGVAQTATQAVRKILGGGDGGPSTSVESSSEPLFHTPDNRDPLKGWSKGVSLRKGHFCLLLKPQLILRSETSTESVCVLTAVQGNLQTYHIMDDVNADDPVSGKIMNRYVFMPVNSAGALNVVDTGISRPCPACKLFHHPSKINPKKASFLLKCSLTYVVAAVSSIALFRRQMRRSTMTSSIVFAFVTRLHPLPALVMMATTRCTIIYRART